MPGTAPRFQVQQIGPGTSGWDAPEQANADLAQQFADEMPHQHKRFYRVSTSNADRPNKLDLKDFPAASYEGHYVYLMDPEVGEKAHVYSDGTDWRYVLSDNALTGIA